MENKKEQVSVFAIVLFLILSFNQLSETVAYGQVNIILLLGFLLTSYWVSSSYNGRAGLILALPAVVKLLPGVIVFYFLIKRSWLSLAGFIGSSVILSFLSISIVGWNNFWFYFSTVIWHVNDPELGVANQSWWGFIGRLATYEINGDFKNPYPVGLTFIGYIGAVVGLSLTFYIIWKAKKVLNQPLNAQMALAALSLVSLWIPPFSWMHYITQGLGSILIVFMGVNVTARPFKGINVKEGSNISSFLFAICFVLLAYGGRDTFFPAEVVGLARFASSYRFFATFLIWALCLRQLYTNTFDPMRTNEG